MTENLTMDHIVSLCKRRGFIFQGSEIYGGIGGFWDYGPLGVELKNNIKSAWWRSVVQERDDVVGLDSAIVMNPNVWRASGHTDTFADPMVDCKSCKRRFRTDEVNPSGENDKSKCPECGGDLTDSRMFNLMFKTYVGPLEDVASTAFLRPETAQGIYVNFSNVQTTTRKKLPFGIAQIGKAFRNEITPGNFIFRDREFEQMEIEYFVHSGTDEEWHKHWVDERIRWYKDLGLNMDHVRVRKLDSDELAHYAKETYEVEYLFPMGWSELEGIANRTDFDLKRHIEESGRDLSYFDEEKSERVVPYIIEPSSGVDRLFLAFLFDGYSKEEVRGESRTVLHLHPRLAPVTVAVLPLSRNDKLLPTARRVWEMLKTHWMTNFDDAQSIGRRYRRQDEIGTPYCVTVDFETIEKDEAVTIRDRDSMEQIRVPINNLVNTINDKINGR